MDNKFETIQKKLNDISITHPNLSEVWKKYIYLKKKHYVNALIDCNNFLKKVEKTEDLERETIFTLMVLKNSIH